MMFHIDEFKCILCSNWFCPPYNLPYLLSCTHSICTNCLQRVSSNQQIICPQDLQECSIQSININLTTKRALQRLMKQHKNYNENTQLQCIKTLSIGFDEMLSCRQKKLRNLQALIDQIFHSEIERLKQIHQKIKIDINRPFKIVQDWKQVVASHLRCIRKNHQSSGHDSRSSNMLQINHYIEEGRKMKLQLNQFFNIDFDVFADQVMRNPKNCFDKNFTINSETFENKPKTKNTTKQNLQNQSKTDYKKSKKISKNKSANESTQFDQLIENSTVVHGSSKHSIHDKQTKPLSNLDMNSMEILQFHDNFSGHTISKRPTNKQKIQNVKLSQSKIKQAPNFDKYITFQFRNQEYSPSNRDHLSSISKNKNYEATTKNSEPSQFEEEEQNKPKLLKQQYTQKQKCLTNKRGKQSFTSSSFSQSERQKLSSLSHLLGNKGFQVPQQTAIKNSLLVKTKGKADSKNQMSVENSLLMSPQTIREEYTQQADSQGQFEEQQLLNEEENNWELGHINFLKEWKVKSNYTLAQPTEMRQNAYSYNCEKQKLNYVQRMQIIKAQQLYKLTEIGENYIELINQSLHDADMNLYLQQFDWKHSNIQIVKLVKTDLKDEQLNTLLNYLVNSNAKTLVLNHNHLTDLCLDAFLNFVSINNTLKNVHLANNPINSLKHKIKINTLKEKGIIIW